MNRFLETISTGDNDILIPIDQIEYVLARPTKDGFEIVIRSEGNATLYECFDDEEKFNARYKMIKDIINAA